MTEVMWLAEWDDEDVDALALKYYEQAKGQRGSDRNKATALKRYAFVLREYMVVARESGFRGSAERTHARLDFMGVGIATVKDLAGYWRREHGVPRMMTTNGTRGSGASRVAALEERIAGLEARLADALEPSGRPVAAGREDRDMADAGPHYALVRTVRRLALRAGALDIAGELATWLDEHGEQLNGEH